MNSILFFSIYNALSGFRQPLTSNDRQWLSRDTGLKRPRRCMPITGAALRAAQMAVQRDSTVEAERLGIISTSGNLHTEHCIEFLDRALQGSPNLVNPLDFSHTLVSALPTTLAEVIEARAFAFSIGEDELAVFEILDSASDLLELGFADCVIAIFASSNDVVTRIAHETGLIASSPADCAIAFRVTATPHEGSLCVQLLPDDTVPDIEVNVRDLTLLVQGISAVEPIGWYGPALGGVLIHDAVANRGAKLTDISIHASRGSRSLRLNPDEIPT